MPRYPYILTRNGCHYFRLAVPIPLMETIGKTELVYSLRTKDISVALPRSIHLLNVAQQGFERGTGAENGAVLALMQEVVRQFEGVKPKRVSQTYILPELSLTMKEAGISFTEAYESYLSEYTDISLGGMGKKRAICSLWVEAMGNHPLESVGKPQAREFKALLMKLPANMKQRYKDKPLSKINLKAIPETQRLSVKTINDHMGYLRAFFNWAIQNGHYEGINPFLGMSLRDKERAIDKRMPFSQEQLKVIFSTPIFKGCRSDKLHDRYIEGDLIIKDGFYWVPLIALYSGARMQEICQLYTRDIKQIDGIWCFDFNEDGQDKHLKNGSSKRLTPIHPKLIELGLLEHGRKKQLRLFPDLPISSDGTYSNAFSKRFNYFLNRFDIKTDKTSFHSFRHTFIDALRNAGVEKEIRQALVGHLDSKSAHDNYGSSVGIPKLGIDILHLDLDRYCNL